LSAAGFTHKECLCEGGTTEANGMKGLLMKDEGLIEVALKVSQVCAHSRILALKHFCIQSLSPSIRIEAAASG
jgi:hypothetical protein